ncbi:MAG: HNH endonuclease [Atribacterota bacterium]|nr:HNH endonuclease [Atribacterota bacterium]
METIKCIYCQQSKPLSNYIKVEHVIPQAFGKFNNNYTLKKVVCDQCNQLFGDTIDLFLSRDTYEGVLRFVHDIKGMKEYKNMGKNSKLRINLTEGPCKGAYAYLEKENGILKLHPLQQIGFYNTETQEFDYYLINDVPLNENLPDKYKSIDGIRVFANPGDEFMNLLKEKGYNIQIKGVAMQQDTDMGKILCEHIRGVDNVIGRAVSKIAFNYLAYTVGAEYCHYNCFNDIRAFIYNDIGKVNDFVRIYDKSILDVENSSNKSALAHLITLEWKNSYKDVIATVSLYNTIKYRIRLSKNNLFTPKRINYGSLFSIGNLTIYPLENGSDNYYQLINIDIKRRKSS